MTTFPEERGDWNHTLWLHNLNVLTQSFHPVAQSPPPVSAEMPSRAYLDPQRPLLPYEAYHHVLEKTGSDCTEATCTNRTKRRPRRAQVQRALPRHRYASRNGREREED